MREHQEVQRGGPGVDRHRMAHATPSGELVLERLDDRALRELAAFEHRHHSAALFVADLRRGDRNCLEGVQLNLHVMSSMRSEARPKTLDERFGDPGGPDPGEPTSSGARASEMREPAAHTY